MGLRLSCINPMISDDEFDNSDHRETNFLYHKYMLMFLYPNARKYILYKWPLLTAIFDKIKKKQCIKIHSQHHFHEIDLKHLHPMKNINGKKYHSYWYFNSQCFDFRIDFHSLFITLWMFDAKFRTNSYSLKPFHPYLCKAGVLVFHPNTHDPESMLSLLATRFATSTGGKGHNL